MPEHEKIKIIFMKKKKIKNKIIEIKIIFVKKRETEIISEYEKTIFCRN